MKYLLVLALVVSSACASTTNPNLTPQASVAHYAGDVIQGVNAAQQIVISLNESGTITVAQALPYMNTIREVLNTAHKLDGALVVYDGLIVHGGSVADRKISGQQVLFYVNLIAGAAGNFDLPASWGPNAAEAMKLIGNVTATLASLKLTLAAQGVTP